MDNLRLRAVVAAGLVGIAGQPSHVLGQGRSNKGQIRQLSAIGQVGALAPVSSLTTAFVDVTVIPMDRERVLPHQTVVVRDGRILELGPAATTAVPSGAHRIDAHGQFLLPGLADMHVHLPLAQGEDHDLRAQQTLAVLLAHGITTVRNMEGDTSILTWRAQVATGQLLGPRIYTAGKILGAGTTPEIAEEEVPAQKAAGYDFIKVYHIMPREAFDTLTAVAARLGMPVAGHVPNLDSTGLPLALAAPYRSVEHLWGYAGYMVGYVSTGGEGNFGLVPGYEDLQNIATAIRDSVQAFPNADARLRVIAAATQRAGVWNTPTLATIERYVGTLYPSSAILDKIVQALHTVGAGLLLGTDNEAVCKREEADQAYRPGVGLRLELAALVRAGLTPYEALAAGTRNAAAFFGTTAETGTIEIGKRADLVLLDRNPLETFDALARPVGVMLRGRWLVQADLDALQAKLGLTVHPDGSWSC